MPLLTKHGNLNTTQFDRTWPARRNKRRKNESLKKYSVGGPFSPNDSLVQKIHQDCRFYIVHYSFPRCAALKGVK